MTALQLHQYNVNVEIDRLPQANNNTNNNNTISADYKLYAETFSQTC